MPIVVTDRPAKALRSVLVCVLSVSALYFAVASWHWAMLCDSPIMHYVNFLLGHGLHPYNEITDNNLPGAYLTESWAMHVFGGGELGWRIYEFFLLGALTLAMAVIAWPLDWVAGVYAGGLFLLLHGAEGPWYSVEREQVMTALLMIGYACMFTAVRRQRPAWMLAMGFTGAMAGSIKPTVAPLAIVLVVMAAWVLWRRLVRPTRYVLWAVAGMAIAMSLNVGFLLHYHALSAFLATQRLITPYYASVNRMPLAQMARLAVPVGMLALAAVAVFLAWEDRTWTWENWALALGAAVGLGSYFAQHKGFLHHRYMLLTFLLLLVGLEFMKALRRPGWPRLLGAGAIVFTLIALVPHYLMEIHRMRGTSDLTDALVQDLQLLGGEKQLQDKVQCLDLVYGCLNALYRLQIVENSGFTGDLLIFGPQDGPAVKAHRALWADRSRKDPATVLVMTNEYFQGSGFNTFRKVDNWPEYARYLTANYTELLERKFPNERGAQWSSRQAEMGGSDAYRIYVRNGSPLLPRASTQLETANGSIPNVLDVR